MPWNGHERRRYGGISDEAFERIAQRAAEIAAETVEERFYEQLGRQIIKRALWVVGAVVGAAILLWARVRLGISFIGMGDDK